MGCIWQLHNICKSLNMMCATNKEKIHTQCLCVRFAFVPAATFGWGEVFRILPHHVLILLFVWSDKLILTWEHYRYQMS